MHGQGSDRRDRLDLKPDYDHPRSRVLELVNLPRLTAFLSPLLHLASYSSRNFRETTRQFRGYETEGYWGCVA